MISGCFVHNNPEAAAQRSSRRRTGSLSVFVLGLHVTPLGYCPRGTNHARILKRQ